MLVHLQTEKSAEERLKIEQLYHLYKRLMFYVARKVLDNNFDAEDAVHQAFLSIYMNLDKVGDLTDPRTKSYVITIVENKAIDIIRKRRKLSKAEFNEFEFGVEIPMPGDFGLADSMAKLPVRYREVLLLKYDNGYSIREIAKLLDINYTAAQKLLWRAKKALEDKIYK